MRMTDGVPRHPDAVGDGRQADPGIEQPHRRRVQDEIHQPRVGLPLVRMRREPHRRQTSPATRRWPRCRGSTLDCGMRIDNVSGQNDGVHHQPVGPQAGADGGADRKPLHVLGHERVGKTERSRGAGASGDGVSSRGSTSLCLVMAFRTPQSRGSSARRAASVPRGSTRSEWFDRSSSAITSSRGRDGRFDRAAAR